MRENRRLTLRYDRGGILIHEADRQLRPVVITIFAHVLCPSVPTFKNLTKQNKVQARVVITTGGTVGLTEWIIDDTYVLFSFDAFCRPTVIASGNFIIILTIVVRMFKFCKTKHILQ